LGQAGQKRIDVVVGIVGQGADRVVESSNQRMTGLPLDAAVCRWLPQAGPAESPDQGWGKSKAQLGPWHSTVAGGSEVAAAQGEVAATADPVGWLPLGRRQRLCSGDSGAAQMGMVHHPLARAMALLTRQTLPGRNQPADQVKLAVRSSIRCWRRWSREVDKGRGCGEAVDKGG